MSSCRCRCSVHRTWLGVIPDHCADSRTNPSTGAAFPKLRRGRCRRECCPVRVFWVLFSHSERLHSAASGVVSLNLLDPRSRLGVGVFFTSSPPPATATVASHLPPHPMCPCCRMCLFTDGHARQSDGSRHVGLIATVLPSSSVCFSVSSADKCRSDTRHRAPLAAHSKCGAAAAG